MFNDLTQIDHFYGWSFWRDMFLFYFFIQDKIHCAITGVFWGFSRYYLPVPCQIRHIDFDARSYFDWLLCCSYYCHHNSHLAHTATPFQLLDLLLLAFRDGIKILGRIIKVRSQARSNPQHVEQVRFLEIQRWSNAWFLSFRHYAS